MDSLVVIKEKILGEFEVGQTSGVSVIQAKGLIKSYGNVNLDYSSVELDVNRGKRIAILGPTGAGKSTFLKLLVGKLNPDQGDIQIGHNVQIGYYGQGHEDISPGNTLLEEMQSVANGISESRIRAVLGHFLFSGEDAFKSCRVLSQGEKSCLVLAKLAIGKFNTLILDEPTNHLDILSKQKLVEAL